MDDEIARDGHGLTVCPCTPGTGQHKFPMCTKRQPKLKIDDFKGEHTGISTSLTKTQPVLQILTMTKELDIMTLKDKIHLCEQFILLDPEQLYEITKRLSDSTQSAKFTFEEISQLFKCPISLIREQLANCEQTYVASKNNKINSEYLNSFQLVYLFQTNVNTLNVLPSLFPSWNWYII
jgi:hypothetical protein